MEVSRDGKSVSGVFGQHLATKSVRGWENYTTAVGGDVSIRLGHAQGVASHDHNTVSIDEPMRLGRFIGIWLRKPPFLNPVVQKYWDYFLQDKILEFQGLVDNELSTVTRTMGSVGREEVYAGYYKEGNGKFTIKVPEVKGSPVRKLMKYVVSGISDPVTGVGHFHGNKSLRFSKINYGGDFLYILTGPTMRPDDIEFSALYLNAFPTQDFIQHLNSGAIGEVGSVEGFDVNFNGTYVQNDEVNKLAMRITEAFGLFKDSVEDVVLPSYLYKEFLSNNTSASSLTDIFGANIVSRLAKAKTADTSSTDFADIITARAQGGPTVAVDLNSDTASGEEAPTITITNE